MIPFVLMLLSIAVMPLAAGKWWQSNLHKLYVSFALAIAAGIYLEMNGLGENLLHQMLYDYLPFIILLASLFIVTGGIRIEGNVAPTPAANVSYCAAALSSPRSWGQPAPQCCSYAAL